MPNRILYFWITIFNVALILVSMLAISISRRESQVLIGGGLNAYLLYSLATLFRTYLALTFEALVPIQSLNESNAGAGIVGTLYYLGMFGILFGNVFYALAMLSGRANGRYVAMLLLAWSLILATNLLVRSFGDSRFIEIFGLALPISDLSTRLGIGAWLWRVPRTIGRCG